jgi:hypothetical protein
MTNRRNFLKSFFALPAAAMAPKVVEVKTRTLGEAYIPNDGITWGYDDKNNPENFVVDWGGISSSAVIMPEHVFMAKTK